MGSMIQFKTPGGGSAAGYLATPKGGDAAPSLVVIQEWWGLNDQIKKVADRFAEAGYRALVPDLYKGRVTTDPDEANHLMTGMDWAGATGQDVRGALQHLKANGRKAAVLGFCMGGAITVLAGVHVPETDVAVCFYGIPPAEAADPARMRVPFQGHFANKDDWCTPAAVDALAAKLKASGVKHELYRYEAQHAFFNEQRPEVYDAKAAQQAWTRALAFLKAHL
jgi:carboxymethylenebutenolidase